MHNLNRSCDKGQNTNYKSFVLQEGRVSETCGYKLHLPGTGNASLKENPSRMPCKGFRWENALWWKPSRNRRFYRYAQKKNRSKASDNISCVVIPPLNTDVFSSAGRTAFIENSHRCVFLFLREGGNFSFGQSAAIQRLPVRVSGDCSFLLEKLLRDSLSFSAIFRTSISLI